MLIPCSPPTQSSLLSASTFPLSLSEIHTTIELDAMKLNQYEEMILGGVGAACAGVFTNPLEVIKTRIQLQGELQARGKYVVHYRNVFQAAWAMARSESIVSLQKGLVPALYYQFLMNGIRFGLYQVLDNRGFIRDEHNNIVMYRSMVCGVSSGLIGAFLGSPLYLVKTHLQSRSDSHIAVGHQYKYNSMMQGFREIYGRYGIFGLWRGSIASMTRIAIGGSIQLTSFGTVKSFVYKMGWFDPTSWYGTLASSVIGSIFVVVSMTPFDVVSTRLYNQPVDSKTGKGKMYNGIADCVVKMFKTEGIPGYYKGFWASFLRLGPHTVLSIFFWQLLRKEYISITHKNQQKKHSDS